MPDIHFFKDTYYLYDTASATSLPGGGSAIGVATAPSLAGPRVDSGAPANTHGPSAAANRQVHTRRPAQPVARSVRAGTPRPNIHCHSLVLDV